AELVQLGRLAGKLLATGLVEPLEPRRGGRTGLRDRSRARGGKLAQGASQHQVRRGRDARARAGTGSTGAGGQGPRFREGARRPRFRMLATVAVDLMQFVRPARV